ncbi:PPOX class probable FMN-dependent enzyme [Bacillus pakistanensis]|uniref:PPOX class probable FMN-dependent enzyme n=2 Tax=Rossellomorea pakistanensis TaxID=992288 RepID=A0ABS2N7J1_9BACI|nr:pyridoxamine 5'-phosphate oxidase family protein [Bacillus pakistanensis]MBM7583794.1 PPOX class probable FMN-dependent enzyme [Bacillus pakistanensis]
MTSPVFKEIVIDDFELREIMGEPNKLAIQKVITHIDQHCRQFISQSPFIVISTSNANGSCDSSPRGDQAGFVQILDDHHLIIPERPGNKRIDSMQNILSNPNIGILFLIPGLGETLRVNGKAQIVKNPTLLEPMAVHGKTPLLGIGVEVEKCFIHCAKAFKRSRLWDPDSWFAKEELPSAANVLIAHAKQKNMTSEEMAERLKEGYTKRLY